METLNNKRKREGVRTLPVRRDGEGEEHLRSDPGIDGRKCFRTGMDPGLTLRVKVFHHPGPF